MFDSQVVVEDSTFSILMRVHANGLNLQQADLSAIAYKIFYSDSETPHTDETALTVSAVIYDTLQRDGRWSEDNSGYNMKHDVAHTVLTDPTRKYKFEYKFTLADSKEFIQRIPAKQDTYISLLPVSWS